MPSLKIEDIVVGDRAIAQLFHCAVCLCIVDDPVETKKCHHIFCKKCVSSTLACPQCRTTPLETDSLQDVNVAMFRAMNDIEVSM